MESRSHSEDKKMLLYGCMRWIKCMLATDQSTLSMDASMAWCGINFLLESGFSLFFGNLPWK